MNWGVIEESQSYILSEANSNQSARTFSTLSDKVYDSYIDLTEEPEELEKPEKPEEEEEEREEWA